MSTPSPKFWYATPSDEPVLFASQNLLGLISASHPFGRSIFFDGLSLAIEPEKIQLYLTLFWTALLKILIIENHRYILNSVFFFDFHHLKVSAVPPIYNEIAFFR